MTDELSINSVHELHSILKERGSDVGPLSVKFFNQMVTDVTIPTLLQFTKLRFLDLGSNRISDTSCSHFATFLSQKSCDLQVLDLAGNRISDDGLISLSSALSSNTSLRSLFLRYNSISDRGVIHLAQSLYSNKSLAQLNLGANNITVIGASELASVLPISGIVHLDLFANNIGDAGASKILSAGKKLVYLNLWANNLSSSIGPCLKNLLTANIYLKELHLGSNSISDAGTIALSHSLKSNTTLKRLDLSSNLIGKEGALALVSALALNRTLVFLNLRCNNIPFYNGCLDIAQVVASHPSLVALNLSSNSLTAAQCSTVTEVLSRNVRITHFLCSPGQNLAQNSHESPQKSVKNSPGVQKSKENSKPIKNDEAELEVFDRAVVGEQQLLESIKLMTCALESKLASVKNRGKKGGKVDKIYSPKVEKIVTFEEQNTKTVENITVKISELTTTTPVSLAQKEIKNSEILEEKEVIPTQNQSKMIDDVTKSPDSSDESLGVSFTSLALSDLIPDQSPPNSPEFSTPQISPNQFEINQNDSQIFVSDSISQSFSSKSNDRMVSISVDPSLFSFSEVLSPNVESSSSPKELIDDVTDGVADDVMTDTPPVFSNIDLTPDHVVDKNSSNLIEEESPFARPSTVISAEQQPLERSPSVPALPLTPRSKLCFSETVDCEDPVDCEDTVDCEQEEAAVKKDVKQVVIIQQEKSQKIKTDLINEPLKFEVKLVVPGAKHKLKVFLELSNQFLIVKERKSWSRPGDEICRSKFVDEIWASITSDSPKFFIIGNLRGKFQVRPVFNKIVVNNSITFSSQEHRQTIVDLLLKIKDEIYPVVNEVPRVPVPSTPPPAPAFRTGKRPQTLIIEEEKKVTEKVEEKIEEEIIIEETMEEQSILIEPEKVEVVEESRLKIPEIDLLPPPPPPQSVIYRSLYHFEAPSEHYMSLTPAQLVEVVGERGGWLIALDENEEPKYVPPSYLRRVDN
ncbi:hypothetical protein RCL1_001583 [Eukaryota sp. TZLM3-RCL]